MENVYNPLQITDEYLSAIGSCVAMWSAHEFLIDRSIGKLSCKNGAKGLAITTEMQFLGKKFALTSIVNLALKNNEIDAQTHEKIKKIIKNTEKLYTTRNTIVHGGWVRGKDGNIELIKFRGRGNLRYEKLFENIDDLNKFARNVETNFLELTLIYNQL